MIHDHVMCCASMFKQMAVGDGGALELEATADTVGSLALGLFRLYTRETIQVD